MRRYMTSDEVIKHAATEDDDLYNEALQTNTRLMVSPYSGGTLNYMPPHHQYPHHGPQPLQHLGVGSTPAADKRWLDVTTIVGISGDEEGGAGYTVGCGADRHVPPSVDDSGTITCSAGRPTVCATHMYESPRFQ